MYIPSASYVLQLEGPNKWPELFEACNHGKQSPVNIDTANVRYSSALTAFEMEGYDSIPPHSSWSIENNGKTGKLSFMFFVHTMEGKIEGMKARTQTSSVIPSAELYNESFCNYRPQQ